MHENYIRSELDATAPRVFACINPLKVTVTNHPGGSLPCTVPNHPSHPEMGSRTVGTPPDTMRADIIGHFQPCMTDIYLHIDARMADYIRTHPYLHCSPSLQSFLSPLLLTVEMMMTVAVGYHGRFYPVISDGNPNLTLFLLHSTIYYE